MKQGYSGSSVRRVGEQVEKLTSDLAFAADVARQADLIRLSHRLMMLPKIAKIEGDSILMEFVEGVEGLTEQNADRAGVSLRLLHDQPDFAHPCLTGVEWLIEMANENLGQANHAVRVAVELAQSFPHDALIHKEPTQFIETSDGRIVFIDIEAIGRGSRYQDLGFIKYIAHLSERPQTFASFMVGYISEPIDLDVERIHQMAGLIALAYAGFADTEKRLSLGAQFLQINE